MPYSRGLVRPRRSFRFSPAEPRPLAERDLLALTAKGAWPSGKGRIELAQGHGNSFSVSNVYKTSDM